jgi:putative DNA primase/helicase
MNKKIVRSSVKNPCPVCNRTKDGDCSQYADGLTVMCKTYVDGVGHDPSQWHYNGVNELGFQGKFVLKTDVPQFIKPLRPQQRQEYFYPDREGRNLVRVSRNDDGKGKKSFYQSHWDGEKWIKGNPDELKRLIPIYRYAEVRAANDRDELIFVVEGEATADALWELGIAATTTIGGSAGYANYGSYGDDLKGSRLVLCPDRDPLGIKYISNFERDFAGQIAGWYLAGTIGLWHNPQGGMDIGDDLNDWGYTKERIIDRIISPSQYQEIFTNQFVKAQLIELFDTELLRADGKPRFTTNWEAGLNWEMLELTSKGDLKRVHKYIGNHIQAIAYVENPEGGGTGVLLEFQTRRKLARRLLIPYVSLVGDGLEALRLLTDKGYAYIRQQKNLLLDYLFSLGEEVERVYTIADKTGWVNGSFLTPAKTYGDPDLRFREPEPDNSMTEIKGTLDGWKSEVAAKCGGNSRLIFGLGTAFAAALLEPAQIESGGFHLAGITSKGKTTTLSVVASVAGLKSIPNWLSTANALEGTAAEFNHGLLPLDEIGQAMDAGVVGASAYMLGNGRGKTRMTKKLTNSPPKTWQLLFLSTGELTMAEYFKRDKISIKGGQEARMPSIPADAGKGYGVFEDIHDYKDAMEFVTALETSVRQQQGTALDAYLTQLVEGRKVEGFDKELRERVHLVAGKLSERFNDTAIGRVAVRFALVQVGLELAHSYGLLPFSIEQCGWAVKGIFEAWVNVRGGEGSIEIKEACNRIEHLFVSNQHNGDRIADVHDPSQTRNLLAYRSNDSVTDGIEFWVPVSIFNKEFVDGMEKSQLIKELVNRGWLKPSGDPKRATLRRRVGGSQQPYFVFSPFWLESEKENLSLSETEKEVYTVYTVYTDAESVVQSESQTALPVYTTENPHVHGVHGCNKNENTFLPQPCTPCTPVESPDVHGCTQLESSQDKGFDEPCTPCTPCTPKKHDYQNVSANNREFKLGDRVKPADPFHERGQDAGIVESIEGEQFVVQWQSDRNLRRYTREELQMVA